MSLLKGLTHAVIFFNTVEGSKSTGVSAMMKLCFGDDHDAIAQVLYSTPAGSKTPVWVLPSRTNRLGTVTTESFPIFTGGVGEEIMAAVGRAADRIKKANIEGKLAGRAFRVTKTTVEEIKPETKPVEAAGK